MKKNVSSQTMDAALQTFLGDLPSKETPKHEPQSANMQEQTGEIVQETVNKPMLEQTDETPQVLRRISGKQRRASCPSKTASPCSSAAAHAMPSTASSACLGNAR